MKPAIAIAVLTLATLPGARAALATEPDRSGLSMLQAAAFGNRAVAQIDPVMVLVQFGDGDGSHEAGLRSIPD